MSGFVVTAGAPNAPITEELYRLSSRVARYKCFSALPDIKSSPTCVAAKFDTPSCLHRGFVEDPGTGSWLLAAGTLIDHEMAAKDGDLSGLLRDYLRDGTQVLARCDGLFGLVIHDARNRTTRVISDPFGFFSIFYAERDNRLYASTSALALAEHLGDCPDAIGVSCFLRTGKVFGRTTLWQRVKRLLAASVLTFESGRISEEIYWKPRFKPSISRLSLDQSIESSQEVLDRTLKRNLGREEKVWGDLTGGYDSRLLLMLLARLGKPFRANTVGWEGHPDVMIARKIAQTCGWEFQHFPVCSDWPSICTRFLPQALGRGDGHLNILLSLRALWAHEQESAVHPTLLSGLGGEMWRGPIWWPEKARLGTSSSVNYARQLWSFMHPIPEPVLRPTPDTSRENVCRFIVEEFQGVGERYSDLPNTFKLDYLWTFRETAHVGTWMSLASGLVRAYPPLFSKDIVEHLMSVNYRYKINNVLIRHVFERCNRALASIEVERRGPALPCRITNFYRFLPARVARFRRAGKKLGQILFHRPYLTDDGQQPYSSGEWRSRIIDFQEQHGLFSGTNLLSEEFFQPRELRAFLDSSREPSFTDNEFLGRILTVEAAMRTVAGAAQPGESPPEIAAAARDSVAPESCG